MSVPQVKKQPTHQVTKMVYDKQSIGRFFYCSFLFSFVIILILCYTLTVIDNQSKQIISLSKMVNELTFKFQQQALKSHQFEMQNQSIKSNSNTKKRSSPEVNDINYHLELNHQQLKKISAQVNKMQHFMTQQIGELRRLIEEQQKSSWETKKIIKAIKSNLQTITKIFQDINFGKIFEIPQSLKPDFGSMGQQIKDTFHGFKDKFGNMFKQDQQNKQQGQEFQNAQKDQNKQNEQKDEKKQNEQNEQGIFSSIKNKIKSKVNKWRGNQQNQS